MQSLKHYKVLHEHDNLPGVVFPQLPSALTTLRTSRIFHFRIGIAIMPPPRPALVGGKGNPCEKEKGGLCEEES
jgi:hypothetical protein